MPNKIFLDTDKVLAFYRKVESLRKTAKEFGCSTPTISKALMSVGVKPYGVSIITPEKRKKANLATKRLFREGRYNGKNGQNWKGGKITAICSVCGGEFKKFKSQISLMKNLLCGRPECRSTAMRDLAKKRGFGGKRGADNHMWAGDRLKINCIGCNKPISVMPNILITQGRKLITCGKHECKKKAQRYFVGIRAPLWQGGVSRHPYPVDFDPELRRQIRDRDNHECQMCGKTEKENGRRLDIHHINYIKEDLEPFNLMSLCRACHAKTMVSRNYWFDELMDVQAMNYIGEVA